MEKFKIIAKTLTGLEEILATEVERLGGINIGIGTRMVTYVGDKELLYKSCLWLRTALRVLKPVETFEAGDPDELYARVKAIDWSKYVAEGQTIAIDATIFSEAFRHSKYAVYRTKDAICDWFTEQGMKRPSVAVTAADVQLNLHISETECTMSLDASGDPLYKRGYRTESGEAPISEVLAAGILMKAGWDGSRDLIDPMCGSGTFLIEAALIATNTPAGIYRSRFGFETWKVGELAYDKEMWQNLYEDDSQEKEFTHRIYGNDISKVAIDQATENVRKAGLGKYITLEVKDFETVEQAPAEGCLMVCNPPYGRRLFTDIPTFYRMIGSVLKKAYQGCEAWIISLDGKSKVKDPRSGEYIEAEPFDFIGLKPSVKDSLNNGGIVCQLRKYEIFAGRFDDFRAEGKNLDKEKAEDRTEGKFTHLRRDRKGGKPAGKERKPFDRERKPFDKDRKPFDKDRKPFDRERKPLDKGRKPYERKPGAPISKYDKDGNLKDEKTLMMERLERRGHQPRKYDPNRPMFGDRFDASQHVLDLSRPKDEPKGDNPDE